MIKYSLGCDKDHEFEGWFGSSDEFARLQKSGLVDCPVCGSTKIDKLLMAPSIPAKSNAEKQTIFELDKQSKAAVRPSGQQETQAGSVPQAQNSTSIAMSEIVEKMPAQIADAHAEMVEKVREFKQHIVDNAEDVGDNFGEEARKIHYGEAEARGIYGKATKDEAVELLEEGVDVMPIPELPEEKN